LPPPSPGRRATTDDDENSTYRFGLSTMADTKLPPPPPLPPKPSKRYPPPHHKPPPLGRVSSRISFRRRVLLLGVLFCLLYALFSLQQNIDLVRRGDFLSSLRMEDSPKVLITEPTAMENSTGGGSNNDDEGLSVDILSIGSQNRFHYVETQHKFLSLHPSVRFFFNVTENDDEDPNCTQRLTKDDVSQIRDGFCNLEEQTHNNPFTLAMRGQFLPKVFVSRMPNPVAWLCAQPRFLFGLQNILQKYRTSKGLKFPHFLVMMDDDTYFNMEIFQQHFSVNVTTEPVITAVCRIHFPADHSGPWGGTGTIYNKASLEELSRPIQCPSHEQVCAQIDRNYIGEKYVFENGMTLIDLMAAITRSRPYPEYREWKNYGSCMHSDWVIGYVVKYYNVSRNGLEAFKGSNWRDNKKVYGQCRNDPIWSWRRFPKWRSCPSDALACHKIKPDIYLKRMPENWSLTQ
jgi:hypothetical protein